MRVPVLAVSAWFAAIIAPAHPQPTTLISLEAGDRQITAELHLPLPELELALGHPAAAQPDRLRAYLLHHVRPVTPAGQPWAVAVNHLVFEHNTQPDAGTFPELLVTLTLTPPAGSTVRHFVLHYDAILHQVVTHKALVSLSDWAAGQAEPVALGAIAVNTGTGRVEPLAIQLGAGSAWQGFQGMVLLGMRHIREGTDHLLFLLVLLLPATLLYERGRWGRYGGAAFGMARLVRIVTAFTLGHSLTLLAGAVRWLQLPAQPVEVLIACSILVTAVHAIRPLFPGREAAVAAGFGLVHGLAFATVLSGLHLTAQPLALSILGFNLGIELMQVFVLFLTMPWLILLGETPLHRWVRITGAVLAGIAALGWIANRVSGQTNQIEQFMAGVTELAPAGVLLLAAIALPAYGYTALRQRRLLSLKGES